MSMGLDLKDAAENGTPAWLKNEIEIGSRHANVFQAPTRPVQQLPTAAAEREHYPICTGVFDYFPDAIAEVAKLSYDATQQHHPGEAMHWARGKSTNHADKILRHQMERQKSDSDGHLHMTKVAWRALAQLQEHLEFTRNLPPSPGSRGKRTWDV